MHASMQKALQEALYVYAKAKKPIDPALFKIIPYFTEIFPDPDFWSTLTTLAGDDGIAYFEKKQFASGEKLIHKGQFDQMIYWILAGHAHIVSTIKKQPKIIHEARKGECIGELGVLRGTIRSADVVAGEEGVTVLELDWALTERNADLAKYFYQLIALQLADKLDNSYSRQLTLIANSITILHEKTEELIKSKRRLEKLLRKNRIDYEETLKIDQEQALVRAIANIKESLSLLTLHEDIKNLDKFGAV